MDIVKKLRELNHRYGVADEAADEIERLRETIATLNESLTITSQGNAKLSQQVATLQGIEAIANEYGIDGFVEIEELRRQVAELREFVEEVRRSGDTRIASMAIVVLARTAKEE